MVEKIIAPQVMGLQDLEDAAPSSPVACAETGEGVGKLQICDFAWLKVKLGETIKKKTGDIAGSDEWK